MQLLFDEDDEEGREADADRAGGGSGRGALEPEKAAPQHSGWELGQNSHFSPYNLTLCKRNI